jgi:PadR family transcriptional regulator, regulatory protein PadR
MTAAIPSLPKDFLRPCLLLLLREKQAHGYDLLERVQQMGFEGVDPGGLYRTLRRLERERLVSSSWEPSESGPQRRIYEITRRGMEELHARAKAIAAGQERAEAFLGRYEEFVALRRDARGRSGNVGRDRAGAR